MTKYNQQFKQEVIEFYLQHQENRALTRQHFGLGKSTLSLWIAQYQHSGKAGLAVLRTKRHYSPEFKLKVIQTLMEGKMSRNQVCFEFGIASAGVITQWLKSFKNQGISGLYSKKGSPTMKPKYAKMPPAPKTEEDRLRLRILELEAEVAFLKKWNELMDEEENCGRKSSKSSKS